MSSSTIPSNLVNLMHGFCASQALFAACDLGIFDALHEATEPQSAKQLSEKLLTDPNATARLMNVLVNIQLIDKHAGKDDEETCYTNTKDARWLTKSHTSRFAGLSLHRMKTSYPLCGNLSHAVKHGGSQWEHALTKSSKDTFSCLYEERDRKINFLEAMKGLSRTGAQTFVSVFDLNRFKRMCDLGGGTGDVAYAVCNKYPNMKITVLDLPQVIQCASHFRPPKDECPNQDDIIYKEGDFFKGPLPTADLYVLTRILHDWGDEKVDLILKNIFNSLPSGGGVLIGELLLNDEKTGPFYPITFDLLMLVTCERGARERSGHEYKKLLEKHGFDQVQYKSTGTNSLDAVFAIKP